MKKVSLPWDLGSIEHLNSFATERAAYLTFLYQSKSNFIAANVHLKSAFKHTQQVPCIISWASIYHFCFG